MPDSYAYIVSNNKIEPILSRVRSAAKPERFTRETLSTWGFTASNDRAMVGVMKGLGFITEAGAPTEFYDRLRDPNDWKYVLAERIRAAYSDLFAIDSNMNAAPETEIKGAMLRITGKDEDSVNRYYATFKTLTGLARFDTKPSKTAAPAEEPKVDAATAPSATSAGQAVDLSRARSNEFHYNIQIHLPVTTDITVYNAIFRSLKENLGV